MIRKPGVINSLTERKRWRARSGGMVFCFLFIEKVVGLVDKIVFLLKKLSIKHNTNHLHNF